MLPFDQEAVIKSQSGDVLATVGIHLEGVGSAVNRVGQEYNWIGDVEEDAAEYLIGEVNRRIEVDGQVFKVIEAFESEYLPHVEVQLREIRGG